MNAMSDVDLVLPTRLLLFSTLQEVDVVLPTWSLLLFSTVNRANTLHFHC
jgi:hypothetical protein